jgi:hypothetical protein
MSSNPSPSPPHELHYAPRPPLHQRWAWRISVLCGGIALALVLYSWSPVIIRHYRLIYWQGKCLNATAAPNQIVFQSPYPGALTSTRSVFPAWNQFLPTFSPIFRASADGTLFLHRLRRPDKTERLVGIDLLMHRSTDTFGFDAEPSIFSTGGMFTSPSYLKNNNLLPLIDVNNKSTLRIYAAQPDDADDSHFTFIIEADKKKYTYDGYLNSDDSILIQARRNPTTVESSNIPATNPGP